MASELHVDAIKHSGGTSALTIDSSGNVHKAGFVVQTSFHTFTDITSVTSSSYSDVGGSSFTFTPKFASSLLHITASVHCYTYRSSTSNGGSVDINVDGSNISASGDAREFYVQIGGSSSLYVFSRQHKEVTVSASNTNAKTIKLQMQNNTSSDSGGFRINDGGNYTSSIKVEELAQ